MIVIRRASAGIGTYELFVDSNIAIKISKQDFMTLAHDVIVLYRCQSGHYQQCHDCPDHDCGDNTAKSRNSASIAESQDEHDNNCMDELCGMRENNGPQIFCV